MNRLLTTTLIACTLLVSSCDDKKSHPIDQPDHTHGTLPMPTSGPATAEEWTHLVKDLDNARAENLRKDRELESAENRKAAANLDTWKRFGKYSLVFMLLGVSLLVAGLLPWTKPFFTGTGSIAFIFIGLGILFGALPHILEQYGSTAFYPLAVLTVLYISVLATIDIVKRISKAKREAVLAIKVLDPTQPEEAKDLIDAKAANNPTFAKALESASTGAST